MHGCPARPCSKPQLRSCGCSPTAGMWRFRLFESVFTSKLDIENCSQYHSTAHLLTAPSQAAMTAVKKVAMSGMEAEMEPSSSSTACVSHAPPAE